MYRLPGLPLLRDPAHFWALQHPPSWPPPGPSVPPMFSDRRRRNRRAAKREKFSRTALQITLNRGTDLNHAPFRVDADEGESHLDLSYRHPFNLFVFWPNTLHQSPLIFFLLRGQRLA